jgi:hypothetical protein
VEISTVIESYKTENSIVCAQILKYGSLRKLLLWQQKMWGLFSWRRIKKESNWSSTVYDWIKFSFELSVVQE